MLIKTIEKDFIEAMKSKDGIKLATLRMLKAELHNVLLAKKTKEKDKDKEVKLEEKDIVGAINKLAKQRKESIEQFKNGNRDDLVQKETKELEILQVYLPKQLTNEEVLELVKKAITETSAQTKADVGKVMKHLMPQIQGKTDGKTVNQLVIAELEK